MLLLVGILISAAAMAVGAPFDDIRIVGGNDTTVEKYPHQVSLEYRKRFLCGGSILNARHVVTATHCVNTFNGVQSLSVIVGITELNESSRLVFDVESFAYNPGNTSEVDGDVAVLKLKQPITFGPKAQPIALVPENKEPRPGEMLTIIGWGRTKFGGFMSNVLQEVLVPSVDRDTCRNDYQDAPYEVTNKMICAGISGKAACSGDSGGPLINDKKELVGIVSWSGKCADPNRPTVFTNVANPAMREFILKHSKD